MTVKQSLSARSLAGLTMRRVTDAATHARHLDHLVVARRDEEGLDVGMGARNL
jgi:hypothetical protein